MASASNPLVNQRSWRLRRFFSGLTNKHNSIAMQEIEVIANDHSALIYGGASPLGAKCVADLKMSGWWVASADFAANYHADANIILFNQEDVTKHESFVTSSIQGILGTKKLDLIYCTPDMFLDGGVEDNLVGVGMEMWQAHMVPSMTCAKLASMFLANNGVLVFTANQLAMKPNTEMIAYSIVQSSVVHLTKCLAIPGSGMPSDSRVLCLLPRYLDTVLTRGLYQHVHPNSFTPLHVISDLVLSWAKRESLPFTGSIFKITTDNCTTDVSQKTYSHGSK